MDKCPICHSQSKIKSTLQNDYIRSSLSDYYKKVIPEDMLILNYELFECDKCSLQFANPLIPGDSNFYKWISVQEEYYPIKRWEFDLIANFLMKNKSNVDILDVGCGSGNFLELLNFIKGRVVGIDITENSILECTRKGIEAYCIDAGEFFVPTTNRFDYIVSFHCLEHVSDPLYFVKSMLKGLKTNGSTFLSTPYSPMSFEAGWFDPLNNPPHHMTRWNKKSYIQLAKEVNCNIHFFYPPVNSFIVRAINALSFSKKGLKRANNQLGKFITILQNPLEFISHIVIQLKREKPNGKSAPDSVLVQLVRKD